MYCRLLSWPRSGFAFAKFVFFLMLLAIGAASVSAATLTVTSTADSGAGSLRGQIAAAASGDTINFSVSGTITLTSSEIAIDKNLIITGPGAGSLTISGNNVSRIFNIGSNTPTINVSLSGLTLTSGRANGADASPFPTVAATSGFGGAIYNKSTGTVSLTDCVILSSTAQGGSGNTIFGGNGAGGFGGAIYNASASGTLSLLRTTLTNNVCAGGASDGSGGTAASSVAFGAGIYNAAGGAVQLTNCIVAGNTGTGGSLSGSPPPTGGAARGAGLLNAASGTVTIVNTTFSNNRVTGGTCFPGNGGEGSGAALYLGGAGSVSVSGSTFAGNIAVGGDASATAGASRGAAIANSGSASVMIVNSTFTQNSVTGGFGGVGQGGAIANVSSGSVALTNVTVSGNFSQRGTSVGGGVANLGAGTFTLANTIVAGNSATNNLDVSGSFTSPGGNLIGKVGAATGFTGPSDQVGTVASPINPLLGVLANNGGPTLTMALQIGSPAINAGNNSLAGGLATDQRGYGPRINNGTVDIGAIETGALPLETPSLIVTTTNDAVNFFDNLTSLREALNYAKTVGGTPTITFTNTLAGQTCLLTNIGDGTFGPSALLVSNLTVTIDGGTNAITISQSNTNSGTGGMRHFYVTSNGNLTLKNLTVSGGFAKGGDSVATGAAGLGGAIVNAGTVNLVSCLLAGNTARGGSGSGGKNGGGGLGSNSSNDNHYNGGGPNGGSGNNGDPGGFGGGGGGSGDISGGLGGFGGGGGNGDANGKRGGFGGGSPLGLAGGFGASLGGAGLGGAVFNYGGTVSATNSTLTGNSVVGGSDAGSGLDGSANGSGYGGAIFNLNGRVTTLNATLANNTAPQGGGAIYSLGDNGIATQAGPVLPGTVATVVLNNTILSGSTDGTNAVTDFIQNTNNSGNGGGFGSVASSGAGNLITSNALAAHAFAGSIVASANPLLGALQNNGGSARTLALQNGSPAFNTGIAAGAPATDQRGVVRPQFGAVDIGAFELSVVDTGQTNIFIGGAFWYLAPPVVGNNLRVYYQSNNSPEIWVDSGAAVRIGQQTDGNIVVQNFAGGVFLRVGSTNGIGNQWQLLTSVVAGDGATWFLGGDGFGSGFYIYRWATNGLPTYSGGAGTNLTVGPDGSVFTRNNSGNLFQRIGSSTGFGSSWQLVLPTETPSLVVTTTNDVVNLFDNLTSLREAVTYANTLSNSPTITFSSSTANSAVNFFDGGVKTITLASGQLVVSNNVTILGSGITNLIISGNKSSRVFYTTQPDYLIEVVIANLTITKGTDGSGGGIYNRFSTLIISNSILNGNAAGNQGGGIFDYGGNVVLMSCVISSNSVGGTGSGGGIYTLGGRLTIINSTINNNSAYFGGGILIYAAATGITNSTICFNSAYQGGGIYNYNYSYFATFTSINNTFSSNSAFDLGGSIYNQTESQSVFLGNTILQSSSGANLENFQNGDAIISLGHNLCSDDGHGFLNQAGDLINTIPQLGPLQNNGGSTLTLALLPGSPAINAGADSVVVGLTNDQRGAGFLRVKGPRVDIGAFEVQTVPPVAGNVTMFRYPTQSAKLPLYRVTSYSSDPDGNYPLGLVSIGTAASGQATVTRNSSYVFYLPAPGFTNVDSFTFVISNSIGATAVGTVNVNLITDDALSQNITSIKQEPAPGGGLQTRVSFAGIPGRTYTVQSTDGLTPANWQTRAAMTADATGRFDFVDLPPLPITRFYRTVQP